MQPSRNYGFSERLAWSQGQRQATDLDTIKYMIPGCAQVRPSTGDHDRLGIDYIAVLHSGVEIFIDAKNRDSGCSRYWNGRAGVPDGEPDLALERWNVVPDDRHRGVIGWTLDERKWTEMILFKFHPSDCDRCYLLGFQHLRMAMMRYGSDWEKEHGGLRYQQTDGGRYRSACVFVPVRVVMKAIMRVSVGRVIDADEFPKWERQAS